MISERRQRPICLFGTTGKHIQTTSQGKKVAGQTVQVVLCRKRGRHREQGAHATLSPATDGAADVCATGSLTSRRQNKGPHTGRGSKQAAALCQPAGGRFGNPRRNFGIGLSKKTANPEQFALDGKEIVTKRLIGDSGKQEAHVAVELVNCTVGLNAGIGFRDETSVGQRC